MSTPLTSSENRSLKQGHAKLLNCAYCDETVLYGAMSLLSLSITKRKPVCSSEICLAKFHKEFKI